MTPEQKIRREILLDAKDAGDAEFDGDVTEENVDELYDEFSESDAHWDYESEFRDGEVETDIGGEYDRNYESKSVARKLRDGTWVGWTYWYGGGKHGNPEEIDWMEYAYDLTVTEEEKLVTVRTFTKLETTE